MLRVLLPIATLGAALLTVGLVSAQSPTTTPTTPAGATTTATASTTPAQATTPTPTPTAPATPRTTTPATTTTSTAVPAQTPVSDFGEPAFNFDVVKEIVAPLVAEDGRTHYVTLSQDTAGIVRVRYSLFAFPEGFYTVYLHEGGTCSPRHRSTGAVWAQLQGVQQSSQSANSSLVLHFYNTDTISLSPNISNSIFDADGTTLAFSIDASPQNIAGRDIACAVLAAPVGAPNVGSGPGSDSEQTTSAVPWVSVGLAFSITGASAFWAMSRRRNAA